MTKQERKPRRNAKRTVKSESAEGNDPVGKAIGSRLKSLYDEVAQEPVPDRFLTLLDQLAASSTEEPDREPS